MQKDREGCANLDTIPGKARIFLLAVRATYDCNSLVSSASMHQLCTHSLDHRVTNTNKLNRHEVYMGDINQPQVIQMRCIHQVVPLPLLYTEHHPLRPSSSIINFGLYICLTNGHLVFCM